MAGSAALAEPVAGWTGLMTGDPEMVNKVRDRFTYQPRTEAAQSGLQAIAPSMRAAGDLVAPGNGRLNVLLSPAPAVRPAREQNLCRQQRN